MAEHIIKQATEIWMDIWVDGWMDEWAKQSIDFVYLKWMDGQFQEQSKCRQNEEFSV